MQLRVLLFAFLLVATARADWWDDFTEKVSGGIHSLGEWVKEKAGPTVREKFNAAKEKLQDPETHKSVREWLSEKAESAQEFAQLEVLPELKKIYEAATASSDEVQEDPKTKTSSD